MFLFDSDACKYDAYILDPNMCMMHLSSSILDYTACVYDAAEILFRTDGRTNKAILGVGLRIMHLK